VGEYDATTGAPLNANFITGLTGAWGLTISGNDLFVAEDRVSTGAVAEYDATTGAAINANLITGLNSPLYVAIPSSVPEPGTWLFGAALAWVGLNSRRRCSPAFVSRTPASRARLSR
jgi:hypothetical protein